MNPFDQWNNQADVVDVNKWLAAQQARKTGGWQPKKSKNVGGKRGSSPTAFISEAGGMGGAIAGAGIGSAILPGIGTLAGGAIGGLIGGFSGKLAEDKIRDDEWDVKDAAKEGAISGVMGASPIRALKVGAAGAKAIKGGTSLTDALVEAGAKTGSTTSKLAEVGADRSSTGLFRFTPKQMTDYEQKFKEKAADTIRRYKFTSPDDIEKAALSIQDDFDDAVRLIPNISKKQVIEELQKKVTKLKTSKSNTNKLRGQQLQQQLRSLNKDLPDSIPATELTAMRREFDGLVNYGEKAADPATHSVNKRTADTLRNVLQKAADDAGVQSDKGESLKDVGRELSKLYRLRDNAFKQSNLGKGSLPIGIITGNAGVIGGFGGAAAGGGLGGVGGAVLGAGVPLLANSTIGRQGIMKTAGGLAKASHGMDTFGASPLGAGARVGAAGAVGGALSGGEQPQTLEDAMMAAEPSANPYDDQYGSDDYQMSHALPGSPAATGIDPSQAQGQADSNPYSREKMIADIQRDPTNAAKYISLYKELAEIYAPADSAVTKPLSAEASKVVGNANSGLTSLSQLASVIGQGGGVPKSTLLPGRDLLGGFGANALGTAGFDTASKNVADVIMRLRTGAAITPSEEKYYLSMLPRAFDKPEVIQQKLALFQDLFESVSTRTGSAGSSLEDALMNAQTAQTY